MEPSTSAHAYEEQLQDKVEKVKRLFHDFPALPQIEVSSLLPRISCAVPGAERVSTSCLMMADGSRKSGTARRLSPGW
jgi:hypothetical protein